MTATTANRMALEGQINQKYERQIEEILGKVVGDGKVVAKVTVDLDFTEAVSTETSYDNENSAVLSEVKNSQNLNGSSISSRDGWSESKQPGESLNRVLLKLRTQL